MGLFCVESPEVRFEDVMRVKLRDRRTTTRLDPTFVEVCEPGTLEVVGLSSPTPALLGAEVRDGLLVVEVEGRLPEFVTVKLSGVRKGRREVRFPRHTEEQMHKNNAFWDQAR